MTAHTFPLRLGLAGTLLALATHAAAVGLGELEVRSGLDEPFDASVALEGAASRPPAGCIRQARPEGDGAPALPRASLAFEQEGGAWRLRLRTRAPLREPALRLRLDAACDGKEAVTRAYDVLLDPRAPAAPAAPMRSMAGDSLASIAAAIYPKRPAVREAYLKALRDANPSLAAVGPDEPIPPGTAIVLPDLRGFSLSLAVPAVPARPAAKEPPVREATRPPRKEPPPKPAAPAQEPAKPAAKSPAATPAATPGTKPAAPAATEPERRPAPSGAGAFVLRLSSPEVDLARSRGIDDATRARLRERLLILDADDQVSALLAMRHSLKQLEGRVNELQLKLSAMPERAVVAPKPVVEAPAPETAKPPEAPKPPESPKPPEAAKPAEPAAPPQAATTAPPPPAAPQPAAPPAKAPAKAPIEAATPAPASDDGVPAWLWAVIAAAVAGIAAVAVLIAKGRGKPAAPAPSPAPEAPPPTRAPSDLEEAEAMMRAAADAAPPPDAGHRVVASSDEALATSVPGGDPVALRRRYIEERFPEIGSGTIAPTDPDSVVKAARLFYEDGSLARAVELLQFAVEENPRTLKPWLALFEIFRLERLAGEFGELAGRFQRFHGSGAHWRKVQFIGRELDPGNPLYQEAAADHLETIGPASQARVPVTFDPLAENWLNAPMDFTTDGLAAGLRAGVLSDAGLEEGDLAPDPMPALKNVEMFTVA